jgi:hypothetical protein
MPREKKSESAKIDVVTKVGWEYNSKTHKNETVLYRTPLVKALHNWERWIDEVVTNTLEMQDISMSDIRRLQHLRSQLNNASENL